jgi:hypothetical protein
MEWSDLKKVKLSSEEQFGWQPWRKCIDEMNEVRRWGREGLPACETNSDGKRKIIIGHQPGKRIDQ